MEGHTLSVRRCGRQTRRARYKRTSASHPARFFAHTILPPSSSYDGRRLSFLLGSSDGARQSRQKTDRGLLH